MNKKTSLKLLLQLLIACMPFLVVGACNIQPTLSAIGKPIPQSEYSEYMKLSTKYENEINTRSNELELSLSSKKASYAYTESIGFVLSLINKTNKDVVILKPNAKSTRVGGYYINQYQYTNEEVIFAVTPNGQSNLPEFSGPLSISSGALGIPPDDFALVKAYQKYTVFMSLPQPNQPLPQGRYSVFVQYRNPNVFAAFVVDEKKESYFLDYHAWMGILKSNSVDFEIIP